MLANENSKDLNYDIVIIGAGPAGITLSLQFNNTNLKIALVESGERYYSESSQQYYQGSNGYGQYGSGMNSGYGSGGYGMSRYNSGYGGGYGKGDGKAM